MPNLLSSYQNGNTSVEIFEDGTKIRTYEGKPNPVFPESIDLKITNKCDLNCNFCHENSSVHGNNQASFEVIYEKLKDLQNSIKYKGIELAIGGGNPLEFLELKLLLSLSKGLGFICNITINQKHLDYKEYYLDIVKYISLQLIKGVGISICDKNIKKILHLKRATGTDNIVYHLICGVHNIGIIDDLLNQDKNCKILILGYKQFGKGKNYYNKEIEDNITHWKNNISKYLGKSIIAFDNLAINQLNIKNILSAEQWDKFYMGDDGQFTMYIDAVKGELAHNSTSPHHERISWNEKSILEYFQSIKK